MKYLKVLFIVMCVQVIRSLAPTYININVLGTGLFLPYSLGVLGYIKKHIPIREYRLTGISGGAWCSVLYALENDLSDHDKIWNYTMGDYNTKIQLQNNLHLFQSNIEKNLKTRYKTLDPEIIRKLPLTIAATRFDNKKMNLYHHRLSEFADINSLIDFCLCSSYIPYISGVLMCREYNNNYFMDGDISRDRHSMSVESKPYVLSIHRNMWGRKFRCNNYVYTDLNTSRFLFKAGWDDTEKNRNILLQYINPENDIKG